MDLRNMLTRVNKECKPVYGSLQDAGAYLDWKRIGFTEVLQVVLYGLSPPIRFLIKILANIVDLDMFSVKKACG
jgi:hypothetical protein